MPTDELPADDPHRRPDGVDDATVEAVGKVSEAMEWVERARGHLYELHQLLGRADLLFGEAADMLDDAGHTAQAGALREAVVGRNVIDGRWTFQIVEEFDDGYWTDARDQERTVRDELLAGRRHVFESEMKEDRRTHGRRHHESRP
jgi:hypothetical protein